MGIREYNKTVDLYSDRVYRFIVKQIVDEAKAQDIVQEAYEKLWLNVQKVNFQKAKSYLFTTAYHLLVDGVRRDKKKAAFDDVDESMYQDSSQYSDLKEILNKAVAQLPEIQRTVVLLRDYEGYSYKEIGEITQLNEAQVKVYIYRARLFLKNYIGSMEAVV